MNLVVFYLSMCVTSVIAYIPSFFPVCLRNDPQISNCIYQSVKALQPRLISGDLGPGFKIPSIEPFYIPRISYGAPGVLRSSITNVYIKGISGFTIEKLYANINNLKFNFILSFPRLDLNAKYQLIFEFFGAPLYSQGDVFGNYENPKVRVSMKGNKYLRNGVEYIHFQPIDFKIIQQNIKNLHFTNLFDGSLLIGRFIYFYLQNNSDFLTQYINPELEKTFSDTFTKIANQIASQASFDEMFPK